MTTLIPRAEARAIQEQHDDIWDPLPRQEFITPADVRRLVRALHEAIVELNDESDRRDALAEADALDALADRYEQEAASVGCRLRIRR